MYNVINSPLIEDLFAVSTKPCLSLYLPTHRTQPERRDDYTRFHQLVRQLTISLENAYSKPEIDMLMAPFHEKSLLLFRKAHAEIVRGDDRVTLSRELSDRQFGFR